MPILHTKAPKLDLNPGPSHCDHNKECCGANPHTAHRSGLTNLEKNLVKALLLCQKQTLEAAWPIVYLALSVLALPYW